MHTSVQRGDFQKDMDAGSGARRPVNEEMIAAVAKQITVPMIVGGGINDPEKAYRNSLAGADIIVVGNAIEKDAGLIKEMSAAVHAGVKPISKH